MNDTANITGVAFSRLTLRETVDLVAEWTFSGSQRTEDGGQQSEDRRQGTINQTGRGKCLAIVNPHSVETAHRDPEFAAAILAADLVTPDGVGILLASKILGAGIPEVVNGPNIFEGVCRKLNAEQKTTRHFFLGSTPENLKVIEEKFKADFPNLGIAGSYSPPYKPKFSEEDLADMIDLINRSEADILWVGLGAPKQEKWAQACRDRLNVKVIAPVGGVFDFYTGRVKLPPKWVQRLGLIFLYRFFQEPKRLWRRNLDSPVFLLRVLMQRIRRRKMTDEL
jgi:N-acetylglucosaminyldiphosphoundecaprenol N-acetyl-beta-D-mannosaminyltransferase